MAEKNNVNGTDCGFIVKTFVPWDQTGYGEDSTKEVNRMCDEFIKTHPELEEVSREITRARCEKIHACFATTVSIEMGICLYKIKKS